MGPRIRESEHRDGTKTVPRHPGACVPELSVPDPAGGEDAVPGRARAPHRRGQWHHRISAGARNARPDRRRGRAGGRPAPWHGGQGARSRRLFRARPASPLFGPDPDPAALSESDHRDSGAGRRRADHAAFKRRGFCQPAHRRADRQNPELARLRAAGTGKILQAGLGRARIGIRLPPRPI